MQETDHQAMKTVQREFEDIAELIESNFAQLNSGDFKKKINLYYVVYTAATRSKLQHVDEHYAAHKELYILSQDILTGYMTKYNCVLLSRLSEMPQESIFNAVVKRWQNYKPMKRWIASTFAYLSRFYIEHQDKPSLETVALSIFYHQLFKHVVVVMRNTLLALIQKERDGEAVDRSAIQSGIELFSKMSFDAAIDVYNNDFLVPYMDATAAYYEKTAALWIANESATDYMEKAEAKLNDERNRCMLYFSSNAEKQIIDKVARELLSHHQSALLNKPKSGFASLLVDSRSEHIRRFCSMYTIVADGLPPLAQILREHCISEGTSLIKQYSGPESNVDFKGYVHTLIGFQSKYMKLLADDLNSLPIFQVAVKEALENIVNRGVTITIDGGSDGNIPCCELLAYFCDALLRKTAEKYTDDEIEEFFDSVIHLLSYVSDKDIFQTHAKKQLSKRLLSNVTSDDQEKVLIGKMKSKFGSTSTTHFESMLNDRNVSHEKREQFRVHLQEMQKEPGFDFSCQILTAGIWPAFDETEAIAPAPVQEIMKVFEEFYGKETKHRCLKWTQAEGTVAITAHYGSKARDTIFSMTPMQGCALMMFADDRTLKFSQIQEETHIDADELKRILSSLMRIKILLRHSDKAQFNPNDEYSANANFSSKNRKLQVPAATPKITVAQSEKITAAAKDDRKPAIDACIVRIMKSRKSVPHQDLVTQVVQQLKSRFTPDPRTIKQRIEDLIDREYIERDGNSYVYLA